MKFERIKTKLVTWPTLFLVLLMGIGLVAVYYRFTLGLGATTNQTDTWAWGLWKGFNVIVLIALAAGGFASAALIYVFGGEKYHSFARSGVLWAILGYGFAGASLVVDIGIPWRIINPIVFPSMWPEESILFEVAWCVMLYLTVLALELAPAVFERFGWMKLQKLWKTLVPWYAVAGLTFFMYLMSHSLVWTGIAAVFFAALSLFVKRVGDKPSTPMMLVMFGIILSTMHQSSLGSLFLLMPDKLSHFWWTPRLPFVFIVSAVAIGLSVLITERTISALIFKRRLEREKLASLTGIIVVVMWAFFGLRVIDVAVEYMTTLGTPQFAQAFGSTTKAIMFFTEVIVGVLIPALLLSSRKNRQSDGVRIFALLLFIAGGVFQRLNTSFIGMTMEGVYVPTLIEIAIAVAVLAAVLFIFTMGVKLLPIYDVQNGAHEEPEETPVSPKIANAPVGS